LVGGASLDKNGKMTQFNTHGTSVMVLPDGKVLTNDYTSSAGGVRYQASFKTLEQVATKLGFKTISGVFGNLLGDQFVDISTQIKEMIKEEKSKLYGQYSRSLAVSNQTQNTDEKQHFKPEDVKEYKNLLAEAAVVFEIIKLYKEGQGLQSGNEGVAEIGESKASPVNLSLPQIGEHEVLNTEPQIKANQHLQKD
jgi:hypothetical protein